MEQKINNFREWLLNRLNDDYNLVEEQMTYKEVLSKFEEMFGL